jgi:integrase
MRLTQTNLARITLAAGVKDKIFFDDEIPNFGLRVRAGGSRKFVIHYRQGGVQHRHTIGPANALTLDEARKRARRILVALGDGEDPAVQKAGKRLAAALTFSRIMEDYLEARQPGMKPRSHEECSRHLTKHWKPLHGLAIGSIARTTIAARLRDIVKASGPVAADRARSTLSAMFAWAIGEGLVEVNPVNGTNKASESKSRERVLSDAELAAISKAAPDNDYGRIVKLLMLTAQRREEIGGLTWSEIDKAEKLIALPSARTKNNRPHDVPLSDAAMAVLDSVIERDGRALVFGRGEGGYSGWSRSKEALDGAAKVAPWTLHDLRRTAATRMADLGVSPHIIEAILNHVSGHKSGVAGIYNRSTYAAEKRAALELWASHLRVAMAKASGANVRELRRRSKSAAGAI